MCVIALKPKGIAFPTEKELKNCFTANPNGAGVGWNDGKQTHWAKGFMTWKEFLAFDKTAPYRNLDVDVCYHFRISTSGGNGKSVTHPFPIVRDDKLLNATEGHGKDPLLFHNGIISIKERDKTTSDTQQYILEVLADPKILAGVLAKDPAMKKLVEMSSSSSKFVVLTTNGFVILNAKQGIKHAGMWYSNTSYIESVYRYSSNLPGISYETGLPFSYSEDSYNSNKNTISQSYLFGGAVREGKTVVAPYQYMQEARKKVFLSETKEQQKEWVLSLSPAGFADLSQVENGIQSPLPEFTYTSVNALDAFTQGDLDIINTRLRRTGTMLYMTAKKIGVRATEESKVTVIIGGKTPLLLQNARTLDGKEVPIESETYIIYDWRAPEASQLVGHPQVH